MDNYNNILNRYVEYLEYFSLEACPAVANMHCNLVRINKTDNIKFSTELTKSSHNFEIKRCRFCRKQFIQCCGRPIYSLPRWGATNLDTFYYNRHDKRVWYCRPWGGNEVWHPSYFVIEGINVEYLHVEMGKFFKIIRVPTQNKISFIEIPWDFYLKG